MARLGTVACNALFNDPCFLFLFLPLLLGLYWVWDNRRWKHALLVISGLAFYSLWDVRYSGLLLAAGAIDYTVALRMAASAHHRKAWLVASLAFNLGVLAIFKYLMFAAATAQSVLEILGRPESVPAFSIVLPIGISFFTFKTMSYTIDVYRREVEPTRDVLKYLAFVSLLADLVAGPIIRYKSLSGQLDALPPRLGAEPVTSGLFLLAVGLFKKAVVADFLARSVDALWAQPDALVFSTAWFAVVGFGLQLYFDFSGYSDMALGIGRLMGLELPVNFLAPFQAINPSDFWRRWHISLSQWLRDYLYVPLGGNRRGPWRTDANLMLTMLLGGLWHGAAWTFVFWGAYHGVLLVAYKHAAGAWDRLWPWAQRAAMVVLVSVGWVWFRAPDLATASHVHGLLFDLRPLAQSLLEGTALSEVWAPLRLVGGRALVVGLAALAGALWLRPASAWTVAGRPRGAVVAGILFALGVVGMGDDRSPFLYYQF